MSRVHAIAWPSTVLVLLVVLLPVIGTMVVIEARAAESPLQAADPPQPIIATVASVERSFPVPVAVTLVEAESVPVVAFVSGIVTSVELGVGSTVDSGTIVATVDDRSIVAYTGERPLWRDLGRGSQGADVSTVQTLLADLGHYEGGVDGVLGISTERAIVAFNDSLELGRNVAVLSRGTLAWIGAEAGTVASLEVQPGDEVTGRTPLVNLDAATSVIIVEQTQDFAADGEALLVIGSATVPYVANSGSISNPDDVAQVLEQLNAQGEGLAQIRLATPQQVATIPASAVVTDGAGRVCVFADASSGPEPVSAIQGTAGLVDVDSTWIGKPVLVNPREVREDLSCA